MTEEMYVYIIMIIGAVGKQQLGKTNAHSLEWCFKITKLRSRGVLTFKNRASYILNGRTATLQMLHFIYFFQQLKY
jgi:hypothetical protein